MITARCKSINYKFFFDCDILALFSLIECLKINKITDAREINAAVVNISGRQRALCQRSALLCLQLVLNDNKYQRQELRSEIGNIVTLMEKSHYALIYGDNELKLSGNMSAKLNKIYFDEPLNLDWQLRNYITEVEALLDLEDSELSLDNIHLRYILDAAASDLQMALDIAVSQYQKESDVEQLAIDLHLIELYQQSQEAAIIAQENAQRHSQALHQLKQTQAQLVHAEKISSLEQLIAGVAHEINNPVSFILGNLYYAKDYINRLLELIQLYQHEYPHPTPVITKRLQDIEIDYISEDFPKLLASMQIGGERISQIVVSLLNFSRVNNEKKDFVCVEDAMEKTLQIMSNQLKNPSHPSITVTKDYASLPMIECYPELLNQVLVNIVKNAIDAFAGTNIKNPHIHIRTQMVGEDAIAIRITDNGVGMSDNIITRIFDPFFTTKDVGKGKGLGLSVSYQIIVEKHRGSIRCISKPGRGTEFSIEIPLRQNIEPAIQRYF